MKMRFWQISAAMTIAVLFVFGTAPAMAQEIGLAWVGKSGMAKRVTAGMEQGFQEFAPGIEIEAKKELGSLEELAKVVKDWEAEKDGMVILRSNGAKWLGKNPPSIPTFIGGCNHPEQLGAVENMKAPEGNITGVTYFLPYNTHFDVFKAIMPDMSSVLLMVEKGHPSSVIDQAGTKEQCAKHGIEYRDKAASSVDEAVAAVKNQASEVSAIILGNQALIIDNTAKLVEAAGDTPVLGYSNKHVKAGALGGYVADDKKLGYMLAESVKAVLIDGKAISDVPVKTDPKPVFYLNGKTAEKLGMEIPYHILEAATIIE